VGATSAAIETTIDTRPSTPRYYRHHDPMMRMPEQPVDNCPGNTQVHALSIHRPVGGGWLLPAEETEWMMYVL
jgi:hypothetical protein